MKYGWIFRGVQEMAISNVCIELRKVDEVVCRYSRLHIHPTLKSEMAVMIFEVGGVDVEFCFVGHEAMIKFCREHNFEYVDERQMAAVDYGLCDGVED